MDSKVILVLMLLASAASAFQLEYLVTDLNTRLPIENATIQAYIHNHTLINTTLSNAKGYASLGSNETVYNETIKAGGYVAQYNNMNTSVNTIRLTYMVPFSMNGIIRIRFRDLYNNKRDFCMFYAENDRLAFCSSTNETVNVLINHRYYIIPELKTSDTFTDLNGLNRTSGFLKKGIWAIAIIIMALALMVKVIWKK